MPQQPQWVPTTVGEIQNVYVFSFFKKSGSITVLKLRLLRSLYQMEY